VIQKQYQSRQTVTMRNAAGLEYAGVGGEISSFVVGSGWSLALTTDIFTSALSRGGEKPKVVKTALLPK
jgi:hypothetical protein